MAAFEEDSDESATTTIWIVTIHDRAAQGYLSFDAQEILLCLGPSIDDYLWVITELNCTGEEAQLLCDATEKTGEPRRVLSTSELLVTSEKFGQTISATIIGAPQKLYKPEALETISRFELFPETQAEIVIRAVDSSFFEVITKNPTHVQLIRKCFQDVREEDPSNYFAVPGF